MVTKLQCKDRSMNIFVPSETKQLDIWLFIGTGLIMQKFILLGEGKGDIGVAPSPPAEQKKLLQVYIFLIETWA